VQGCRHRGSRLASSRHRPRASARARAARSSPPASSPRAAAHCRSAPATALRTIARQQPGAAHAPRARRAAEGTHRTAPEGTRGHSARHCRPTGARRRTGRQSSLPTGWVSPACCSQTPSRSVFSAGKRAPPRPAPPRPVRCARAPPTRRAPGAARNAAEALWAQHLPARPARARRGAPRLLKPRHQCGRPVWPSPAPSPRFGRFAPRGGVDADAACPISTGGGTRRVRSVRGARRTPRRAPRAAASLAAAERGAGAAECWLSAAVLRAEWTSRTSSTPPAVRPRTHAHPAEAGGRAWAERRE